MAPSGVPCGGPPAGGSLCRRPLGRFLVVGRPLGRPSFPPPPWALGPGVLWKRAAGTLIPREGGRSRFTQPEPPFLWVSGGSVSGGLLGVRVCVGVWVWCVFDCVCVYVSKVF